jgi:hypothetical protein
LQAYIVLLLFKYFLKIIFQRSLGPHTFVNFFIQPFAIQQDILKPIYKAIGICEHIGFTAITSKLDVI